jgi:ABC-type transporter Mla subunit MlaD
MKTALLIALLALIVALIGGVLLIVHDAHRDLSDFHTVIDQAAATARSVEGTTHQLNQTIAQVNTTVGVLTDAANAQKKNWLDASADVKKTGEDTRRVVAHVDRILTHFDVTTLPALDMQIVANGDQLQDTIGRLGDSADGVTAAAKTLDAQLSNPEIPQMIGHFNTISGNLEVSTANFATMTGDAVPAVHRFTAAPTKKQKFLQGAKDFGGLIYLGVKIATLP